jgi:hypothetical protein
VGVCGVRADLIVGGVGVAELGLDVRQERGGAR